MPYARTIGARPARVFGVNSIGLSRRGSHSRHISQSKGDRYLPAVEAEHERALAAIRARPTLAARRWVPRGFSHVERGVIRGAPPGGPKSSWGGVAPHANGLIAGAERFRSGTGGGACPRHEALWWRQEERSRTEGAATRHGAGHPMDLAWPARTGSVLPQDAGGAAVLAGQVKHNKIFSGGRADLTFGRCSRL